MRGAAPLASQFKITLVAEEPSPVVVVGTAREPNRNGVGVALRAGQAVQFAGVGSFEQRDLLLEISLRGEETVGVHQLVPPDSGLFQSHDGPFLQARHWEVCVL